MKFEIKQATLSDEQIKEVNTSDSYPEFYKKYLDITSKPSQESVDAGKKLFQTCGFIEAENHNGVFQKGNIWEGYEGDVEHVGPGMHSISVGDIITDTNGDSVVVDNFGFQKINF